MNRFYELFLKTRYTHSTSLVELEAYREMIKNNQFDVNIDFDKRTQVKTIGYTLSEKSEKIDRQILKNNFETYALFAINQDILRVQSDQGYGWVNASSEAKAIMLKYYRIIAFGTPNDESLNFLKYILKNNYDLSMIPQRSYEMNHDELVGVIKIFEPDFKCENQMEADLGK